MFAGLGSFALGELRRAAEAAINLMIPPGTPAAEERPAAWNASDVKAMREDLAGS